MSICFLYNYSSGPSFPFLIFLSLSSFFLPCSFLSLNIALFSLFSPLPCLIFEILILPIFVASVLRVYLISLLSSFSPLFPSLILFNFIFLFYFSLLIRYSFNLIPFHHFSSASLILFFCFIWKLQLYS